MKNCRNMLDESKLRKLSFMEVTDQNNKTSQFTDKNTKIFQKMRMIKFLISLQSWLNSSKRFSTWSY